MYTRCPHCSTFFAVSPEQLGAADGRVRCGSCLAIFDGLKHLTERPSRQKTESSEIDPGVPQSDRSADDDGNWQADVDPDAFDSEASNNAPPTLGEDDVIGADQVPEAIRDDLARAEAEHHGRWRTAVLTIFALILLAALGVQYAWFKPVKVLAAYPQARSWLESFCAYTGCRLPDRRDPSKIQMLARDVRVHPGYEGALLVSATLVNAAARAQPYPRLQFSVFNVNGQTIASRVFEPEEYLSSDLDPKGDMSPGKPLQIVIELIAPEEAAISYEFRFL
ncbi:MAG TPA: DUF3426 domain-containing protein [Gammaproteobacteria bacterium]|nr:DUF3426 domain-containing protein [Gammaproteobacteria bacterium]